MKTIKISNQPKHTCSYFYRCLNSEQEFNDATINYILQKSQYKHYSKIPNKEQAGNQYFQAKDVNYVLNRVLIQC
jgi:hypothetical protein